MRCEIKVDGATDNQSNIAKHNNVTSAGEAERDATQRRARYVNAAGLGKSDAQYNAGPRPSATLACSRQVALYERANFLSRSTHAWDNFSHCCHTKSCQCQAGWQNIMCFIMSVDGWEWLSVVRVAIAFRYWSCDAPRVVSEECSRRSLACPFARILQSTGNWHPHNSIMCTLLFSILRYG